MAISGHQWQSVANRGNQRQSEGHFRVAISGHQWQSVAIRGNQKAIFEWPSRAIRGNQRPSDASRGHQRIVERHLLPSGTGLRLVHEPQLMACEEEWEGASRGDYLPCTLPPLPPKRVMSFMPQALNQSRPAELENAISEATWPARRPLQQLRGGGGACGMQHGMQRARASMQP